LNSSTVTLGVAVKIGTAEEAEVGAEEEAVVEVVEGVVDEAGVRVGDATAETLDMKGEEALTVAGETVEVATVAEVADGFEGSLFKTGLGAEGFSGSLIGFLSST